MLDFDICNVGGATNLLAHRRMVDHKFKHPFQLVFTHLLRATTLETLRGHKYVSKISDHHTKWKETFLLKPKGGPSNTFQSFVQYVAIPNGFYIERLRTDKGNGYINKGFNAYCLQTGASLEYAAENWHVRELEEFLGLCLGAYLPTANFRNFSWG